VVAAGRLDIYNPLVLNYLRTNAAPDPWRRPRRRGIFVLLCYTFKWPGKWLKLVNFTGGKSSVKTQLTYHGTINGK
jgi:hypothetical protein